MAIVDCYRSFDSARQFAIGDGRPSCDFSKTLHAQKTPPDTWRSAEDDVLDQHDKEQN